MNEPAPIAIEAGTAGFAANNPSGAGIIPRPAKNEWSRERRPGNGLAPSTRRKNLVLLAILVFCVGGVFAQSITHLSREAAGATPVEQK